ncbi:hypothetical protein CCR75_006858 [Bremia lactucae]|uniref:Uncharacterized protein n=1 Tax=Bremia lactucae TaxID=4779 RepID=A0A976IAZ0_BRELC|nr:hypothetical protein CCR75_006858 [Bremia lactucae]
MEHQELALYPLVTASLENSGMGACKGGVAKRRAIDTSRREECEHLENRKERFEAFRTNMPFY